jgi:hypothetical protein
VMLGQLYWLGVSGVWLYVIVCVYVTREKDSAVKMRQLDAMGK